MGLWLRIVVLEDDDDTNKRAACLALGRGAVQGASHQDRSFLSVYDNRSSYAVSPEVPKHLP